jgi:hypothetical protein
VFACLPIAERDANTVNRATILSAETAENEPTAGAEAFRWPLLFAGLFCLFLLPAVINGFPLVMDDSIAYSGQGVHWMRSKTAAVIAAPFYSLLGYWGLPILNALLTAGAWTVFSREFRLGPVAFVAVPLSILALQPIYASAVLVDIWFFCAILFAIVAMKRPSSALAILSGILLSSHGSGILLLVPFAIAATITFRRSRYLAIAGLSIVAAFAVNMALDLRFHPDKPRLEKTFLSGRLFSAYPELLERECRRSGDNVLCDAARLVADLKAQPENAGRRDFFWDVERRYGSAFDLATFEREHATSIILDAATWKPLNMAGLVIVDFTSFYLPQTRFDFISTLSSPMPAAFGQSTQAVGSMESGVAQAAATALRYLLYAGVIFILVRNRKRLGGDDGRWIAVLLALCLANDALFAALSGPPDRYHHRILGFLAMVALLAFRAGKSPQQSPEAVLTAA